MNATNRTTRVLAVDIGTSSVRAMVFDPAGAILARTQIGYDTVRPAPNFEEQDPVMVRREVYRAMAECLAQPGAEPSQVRAIAFSAQMYGIFPLDGSDRPLTRIILWSDGRAEQQAEALKRNLGERAFYPETGCPMNSIYPLAKLVWLRERQPEVFAAAVRFASIKEFVVRPLVGDWLVDHSLASATGLLDIRNLDWHPGALAAAGISARQLPRPCSGLEALALERGGPLEGLGLPPDVRVFLGGGDGPLANVGSGASGVGAINIDLGTSGAARCIADAPTVDDAASLWCYCLADGLWAYGGIVTNVGNAYQWLGANIVGAAMGGESAYALMNDLAAGIEPGSAGLNFLPYLCKARSPWWDGRLKATLYGLAPDHGAGHLARALLEAVAYDLKAIIGLMDRRVRTVPEVILTGGLSRSPIMPQLLADVLGRELRTPDQGEGSVAGAAILAFRGLGLAGELRFQGGPRAFEQYLPDPSRVERYDRLYRRHLRLIEAMRSVDLEGGSLA